MKYKFTRESYSSEEDNPLFDLGVEIYDDSISALEHIGWWGWTVNEAQMIIDESKKLKDKEIYDYIVEGSELRISVDKDYVYFFDWRTEQVEEDFNWTFDEFIEFMEAFKIFIMENA